MAYKPKIGKIFFLKVVSSQIFIEVVRLNDWAIKPQIDKIDVWCVGLQGYELKALEGKI